MIIAIERSVPITSITPPFHTTKIIPSAIHKTEESR
jgi:hypothetical protein